MAFPEPCSEQAQEEIEALQAIYDGALQVDHGEHGTTVVLTFQVVWRVDFESELFPECQRVIHR